MAANNNDARKKQKKTEAVDNDGDSLLPTPVVVVPPAPLSFGNILKAFPDFLFYALPYIADRVIWNSIASSNKDMHEKSKTIQPPWPLSYKLPSDDGSYSVMIMTWSPCGTRIACSVNGTDIKIFDQQRGPLRRWQPTLADEDDYITALKFSPDGSFLVSIGNDSFVRLWDNVTGNYEQLQDWNMAEKNGGELNDVSSISISISISTCSKYMAVSMGTCSFLLDVENRGKTIKSLMPPFAFRLLIDTIQFSSDDHAIFICRNDGMIQVWHPYLDDDDDDRLITLTSKPDSGGQLSAYNVPCKNTYNFSNDNTMVVVHRITTSTGIVWSIDTDQNYLTQKPNFQSERNSHTEGKIPYFTPDDKYIVCNKKNKPTFWSLAESKFTNNPIQYFGKGSNCTKHNNLVVQDVVSISPKNRQCIVQVEGSDTPYITSYFVADDESEAESTDFSFWKKVSGGNNQRLLMLLPFTSRRQEQKTAQDRALTILEGMRIVGLPQLEQLDGADPTHLARRNALFALSEIRGHYPQFFLVRACGKVEFFADWEQFELLNDAGRLAQSLNLAETETETYTYRLITPAVIPTTQEVTVVRSSTLL